MSPISHMKINQLSVLLIICVSTILSISIFVLMFTVLAKTSTSPERPEWPDHDALFRSQIGLSIILKICSQISIVKVKEFVCLSVCLSVVFDPNYLRTG